jgi:hypothetical protein
MIKFKIGQIAYMGVGAKEEFGEYNVVCIAKVKITKIDKDGDCEISVVKTYFDNYEEKLKDEVSSGLGFANKAFHYDISGATKAAIKGLFSYVNR